MSGQEPYYVIRSRAAAGETSQASATQTRAATHDISRTSFHVKHISQFAQRVEESASRAFPNRGRSSRRYTKVQSLLIHWRTDDLFVLPELEDLEQCLREEYGFGTDIWAIPSENSHLELMMRLGQLIKDYESQDTLLIVYYGGHARIDEARQSTWCATRDVDSPWLQWSAIQTLLERSKSDVLILLDCCAGAASATFPTGNSITETISASSWDAIAPDPGRYSFTNALIEVMQEWRNRAFSAAMLHAEVLARLKHPRPININSKRFEARSTPVHFMMTANHKAPSIEIARVAVTPPVHGKLPDTLPVESWHPGPGRDASFANRDNSIEAPMLEQLPRNEPDEDTPHVMISLALEDDQRLDINAWEQWLNAFPAMAKYVKVQGVFKSHSTLLLVSMPVMVWDLLPEDQATSFIGFIRSNNLAFQKPAQPQASVSVPVHQQQPEVVGRDDGSLYSRVSGTTVVPSQLTGMTERVIRDRRQQPAPRDVPRHPTTSHTSIPYLEGRESQSLSTSPASYFSSQTQRHSPSASPRELRRQHTAPHLAESHGISQQMILNQQQQLSRTTFGNDAPEPKRFAPHVERRLEEYYQVEQFPNDAQKAFFASNLGVEPWHVEVWFHHRREKDVVANRLAAMELSQRLPEPGIGPRMILPADLHELLSMSQPGHIMVFDMRSGQEFERSHIHRAINLRMPKSFLQAASLDLIENAIPDDGSREQFSKWRSARCLVFYGKGLDQPWECPAAELLFDKLQEFAWFGRCFILKGHYREFSDSFDRYIVGSKMAREAEQWVEEQERLEKQPVYTVESQERYTAWLSRIETGDHLGQRPISPSVAQERAEALEAREQTLDAEFQAQHAELHEKARDLQRFTQQQRRSVDYDMKAQIVEHLDRGLTKMREAQSETQGGSPSMAPAPAYDPGHSKLADDSYLYRRQRSEDTGLGDEYVEVAPGSGESPVLRGRSLHAQSREVEDTGKGGRGGLLHKVFRRS